MDIQIALLQPVTDNKEKQALFDLVTFFMDRGESVMISEEPPGILEERECFTVLYDAYMHISTSLEDLKNSTLNEYMLDQHLVG